MNIKDTVLKELGATEFSEPKPWFGMAHGDISVDAFRVGNGRYFLDTLRDEHNILHEEIITHAINDDEDQSSHCTIVKFIKDDESVTIKFIYNLNSYDQAEYIHYQIVKPVEVTQIKWVSL